MGALRFFLALAVVLWHAPLPAFKIFNAVAAVAGFFVISGFYMAMIITETYRAIGQGWVFAFYRARALRIYVPYWVTLATLLAMFLAVGNPTAFTLRLPLSPLENIEIALMNVTLVGFDTFSAISFSLDTHSLPVLLDPLVAVFRARFFDSSPYSALIGQAWSLSSELTFYAIAPFIVWSPRRTAVAFVLALANRIVLIGLFALRSDVWGYRFFPATACLFLLGSLAYHCVKRLRLDRTTRCWIGAGALGALGVWTAASIVTQGMMLFGSGSSSIDTPVFWLFYVLLACSVPFIFELTRNNKWDRALGNLSYPLYLSHGIVLGLVFEFWRASKTSSIHEVIAVGLCIIVAYSLRCFVDDKIDAWRHRLVRRELGSVQIKSLKAPYGGPLPTAATELRP